MSLRSGATGIARRAVPAVLAIGALRPSASRRERVVAACGLVGLWTAVYRSYRREGRAQTAREYDLLRTITPEALARHYNERVPTVEEELELWGAYHQHRHEMRYDLVADAARRHLPRRGRLLDSGCGSAMVADRLLDLDGHYVGVDFGGHHIASASRKFQARDAMGIEAPPKAAAGGEHRLSTSFVRGDGERLPFREGTFDVVVMSEVIEHLVRPELSVWEVARLLRPAGVFVMTTNNAAEVPLRSPLSHMLAWLEKAVGANRPALISRRPWVWPVPVDRDLLPDGAADVYVPHTHHIAAETRALFRAAGLETVQQSTFEFPPPQSATARWLDRRGAAGRLLVDGIEAVARHTPLVKRLGCHLFVVARKTGPPAAVTPPPGVWPGPFSTPAAVAR